jgi:RHS repeat-associated protein
MTADGVHTYAYDAEGNLNSVDSGSTLTETYNALGWRVEANKNGYIVDYQHDAAGEMIGGVFPGGSNQFIYFRGGLMAEYWNGASFAHLNGLGSTQQFTNWSGTSPMDTLFYPWGQPANSSVESLWAGFNDGNGWLLHEWQTDTRRYTPSAGRWFTPDPAPADLTNPQSLNRYAYVLNNPTTLTDPTGLMYCDPNSAVTDNNGTVVGYTDCLPEEASQTNKYSLYFPPQQENVSSAPDQVETEMEDDETGDLSGTGGTGGSQGIIYWPQVQSLVHQNNKSKQCDELIDCIVFKESHMGKSGVNSGYRAGFNTNAGVGVHAALGLMQLEPCRQGGPCVGQYDPTNPAQNIQVGSNFLQQKITSLGSQEAGVQSYGPAGEEYANHILDCASDLKAGDVGGAYADATGH